MVIIESDVRFIEKEDYYNKNTDSKYPIWQFSDSPVKDEYVLLKLHLNTKL